MSPVAGSEIPIEKVPMGVSSTTAADIQRTGDVTAQQVLQSRVPGVIVSDLQGNEFQTDVQYRGFSSSPVNGVPQGLAVYQNGVRINEAFGDIVNWDFLPSNAVSSMTVMSSNPVFGLNAIGGAISVDMRDGFNFHGAEFDVRGGSFGRIQGSGAVGAQNGNWAMFIAAEDINDDGWRQFSPAEVHRMYADLGFKNREAKFHVNFTGADNFVGAVTAAPVQLLDQGWNRVYPNINRMQMDQISHLYPPARFIKEITVKRGNELVFKADTGISISTNPYFRFTYANSKEPALDVVAIDSDETKFEGHGGEGDISQ
jgi:outer membrane receptor protein involved in Fe transport